MTTPTVYAGPLLPVTIVNTVGRVQPNRNVVIIRRETGAEATLYTSPARDLAPTPYSTDKDGNLTGYFAEPGHYLVRAMEGTDVPEAATAAVIGPEEIDMLSKMPGPEGPQGTAGSSTKRWHGVGPPGTIIGAAVGDEYLDLVTGDLYTLD